MVASSGQYIIYTICIKHIMLIMKLHTFVFFAQNRVWLKNVVFLGQKWISKLSDHNFKDPGLWISLFYVDINRLNFFPVPDLFMLVNDRRKSLLSECLCTCTYQLYLLTETHCGKFLAIICTLIKYSHRRYETRKKEASPIRVKPSNAYSLFQIYVLEIKKLLKWFSSLNLQYYRKITSTSHSLS